MSKTVFVVGGDISVVRMFQDQGYLTLTEREFTFADGTNDDLPVDIVCFTGGSDIHPRLYGEKVSGAVGMDENRDRFESFVWKFFSSRSTPFVGICRGAQFLTVMNGGSLIQHKTGHSWGDRLSRFDYKHEVFTVQLREDHHQMMVPSGVHEVIARDIRDENPEVVFFPETQSLAFQAHPEWGHEDTRIIFFNLMEELLDG